MVDGVDLREGDVLDDVELVDVVVFSPMTKLVDCGSLSILQTPDAPWFGANSLLLKT